MPYLRRFFINLALSISSIIVLCLMLEFLIFRFVLIAPDMPALVFVDDILKYRPEQVGTYRVQKEIAAMYRINRNGWNSKYDAYDVNRPIDKTRVAVIGDSFVEALQVDYDKSLAAKLEIAGRDAKFEVYRFGISGIPLSQYLWILKHEAMKYSPDIVIVILVHNDFEDSYLLQDGEFLRNSFRLKIEDNSVTNKVYPKGYFNTSYLYLRRSATIRFLRYRKQISFRELKGFFRRHHNTKKLYQANIDIGNLAKRMDKNQIATRYILEKMRDYCHHNGAILIIAMDGVRELIYYQNDSGLGSLSSNNALELNNMAARIADDLNIYFLDLHKVFKMDYMQNHTRFDFMCDMHWNEYAHKITAEAIIAFIDKNDIIDNTMQYRNSNINFSILEKE